MGAVDGWDIHTRNNCNPATPYMDSRGYKVSRAFNSENFATISHSEGDAPTGRAHEWRLPGRESFESWDDLSRELVFGFDQNECVR